MTCEGVTCQCGSTEDVREEPSRTAYDFGGVCKHEDCLQNEEMQALCYRLRERAANPTAWLCRPCSAVYHQQWDDQWNDYYAGLM